MFLPEGSQDEVGFVLDHKAKATRIFRQVARSRHFKAISTPVVEYATTFTNEHVGMKLHSMLKWFNRDGDIEVLRADWTTAIARALMKQPSDQKKWFYEGSVFRNDKDGIESKQAGIEIVRAEPFLGEAESLLTAVRYLDALNVSDYLIELGHTGIFDELIRPLQLNQEQIQELLEAMHDKRRDIVYQLVLSYGSQQTAEQLVQLIDAYGSVEELQKFHGLWKDNKTLSAIFQHLIELVTLLEASGVEEVLIDLGRVKNLPYYCGTMFRGYIKKTGDTCFSGGRYDKLYAQFNEDISAVGLAFDLDILSSQLQKEEPIDSICILASPETHVKAEKLRATYSNAVVDIQYDQNHLTNYDRIVTVDNEILY